MATTVKKTASTIWNQCGNKTFMLVKIPNHPDQYRVEISVPGKISVQPETMQIYLTKDEANCLIECLQEVVKL
jgi:HSP20 family molecular chaperone IbpA